MFNEQDIKTLNDLPLVDVLAANGLRPHSVNKERTRARYVCPWHNDSDPSLVVDMVRRGDNQDLGFKCFGCGKAGYGAIALQAAIMNMPYEYGALKGEAAMKVMQELAEVMGVDVGGNWIYDESLRNTTGTPLDEAEWELAPTWTEEHLKGLGFEVKMVQKKAKTVQQANHEEAEVQVGDWLTEMDADTGEPLFTCSIDTTFYKGRKAVKRTLQQWGEILEQMFHVHPLSSFTIPRVAAEKGGVCSLTLHARPRYPIYVFVYPSAVKKYEPYNRSGQKWGWYSVADDASLETRVYGDAETEVLLRADGPTAAGDGVGGGLPISGKHPTVTIKEDNNVRLKLQRLVLCSGPRDAMQIWAHTEAHVCWLHSEQAGFEGRGGAKGRPNPWLRATLKKLRDMTVEGGFYVCYDEDETGISASRAIALNDPRVRWLRLPRVISGITDSRSHKPCKDVTDFVTHFAEVQHRLPDDLRADDPVEWLDNAMFDTPTCQFWQWESERKDADGTGRNRYKFDLRNTPVFLCARGMVRSPMQTGRTVLNRYFMIDRDRIYEEIYPGEKGANRVIAVARDLMREWLTAHKEFNDDKGALSRAILGARLDTSTLETIEAVELNDKSFGPDFDHFFFENCAVRVTKDEVKTVSYSQLGYYTNRDCIMTGTFRRMEQPWHIVVNPQYEEKLREHEEMMKTMHTSEERAQENVRWDKWQSLWKFRLIMDKPFEEMPMHFQFCYNVCRTFWEKESLLKEGEELMPIEKQMQDMNFIAYCHALGSVLVRYRPRSRQQWVWMTDSWTRSEELASGGTGKSATLDLIALIRPMLRIDGKTLEGNNMSLQQELAKITPGKDSVVGMDETPKGFTGKELYNYTATLTARGLYRESITLEGDDVPKFIVSSNDQLDLSSDSTSRRTYEVPFGDWYHSRSMDGSRPAHTPADDFQKKYGVKEIARNLPPQYLNEAYNLLIAFTQFFLMYPDETIRPPRDSRAMLRQALAASKDKQFTKWASEYFADKRHRGYIDLDAIAISLCDYCGIVPGKKTISAARKRFVAKVRDFLQTYNQYVVNPSVALDTATDRDTTRNGALGWHRGRAWVTPTDADGQPLTDENDNRVPRKLMANRRCVYICDADAVPAFPFDPAHIGDKDYVQPVSFTDPES